MQAHLKRILDDLPAGVADPKKNIVIVFAETYETSPAKMEWAGTLALGSRTNADAGFGVFSSWILRDELCAKEMASEHKLLFDERPLMGRVAMGSGKPNSPRSQFIQDGIGAVGGGFHYVKLVDGEILPQRGQLYGCARCLKIIEASLKELLIGED